MEKKVNLLVGLFVTAGLIALLFLSLKASNLVSLSSGPSYEVFAYFDDIGGLKARAAVRSAGVLVGRVKRIEFDDKRYQALVVIDIDSAIAFPKDSSAQILTSGLLGEKYIGLLPGAEETPLKDRDRIQLTQSALGLESVISQFLYSRPGNDSSAPRQ